MLRSSSRTVASIAVLLGLVSISIAQPANRWFKGNTHAHTINSDGDSLPSEVVKWYKDAGYDFLVITDHEFITPIAPLNSTPTSKGLLVISGQEVTDRYDKKPYHINGLGLTGVVRPAALDGAVVTLQRNIDNVRAAGAVPQLNHPNFGWALSSADILKLKGVKLLEIFNGHPLVNNQGGGGSRSTEQIWDELLTAGMVIYGVADDDVHHLKRLGDRTAATPGHGWVMVRASELTAASVLQALDSGDFYASTGVELLDLRSDPRRVSLTIKTERWSKYTIQFIGSGGRVLKETHEVSAVYEITGNEGYVRAKVLESNGKAAWTQPVFVRAKREQIPSRREYRSSRSDQADRSRCKNRNL
jgi:hypothetical protein